MPASPLPGGEGAILRLPSAPHRADSPSAIHHPLHIAGPQMADNGQPCQRPVATLHTLFSPRPPRARTNVLCNVHQHYTCVCDNRPVLSCPPGTNGLRRPLPPCARPV